MLKLLPAAALILVAGCSDESAAPLLKQGTYLGGGRNALCISGEAAPQHGAFIAFAPTGDNNCAAQGRVERQAGGWALVPAGEGDCRIPIISNGESLAFGPVPATCAYYCGPGANFVGQQFKWTDTSGTIRKEEPLGNDGVC